MTAVAGLPTSAPTTGPVGLVLERVKGAKSDRRGGWVVRCPAHDDHDPSLAITSGTDGRALLVCRAGCQPIDVLRALGLEWRDLFADAGRTPDRFEVARYSYDDENGQPLYDVVRFDPKDFRQQAASGEWSMTGVRRVPYRLPELLEAGALGKRIYVVEGEKDAAAIARNGGVATTNVGGAGKWRDEYSQALVGARDVVVLPDNDPAGEAHAESVAVSLAKAGIPVRVLRLQGLPPKGDVSDWLRAGGTVARLDVLADETPIVAGTPTIAAPTLATPISTTAPTHERPPFALTVIDRAAGAALNAFNSRPVDAIPTGFPSWDAVCDGGAGLERGWHVIIGGASGRGKSLLALNVTNAALEAGRSVGFISCEMSTRQLMGRLYALATGTHASPLKRGPRYDPARYRNVVDGFAERRRVTGSELIIVERPQTDVRVIVAAAEQLADRGCQLIVVDYFQLLSARGIEGVEAVKAISGAVRDVAFRFNVVTLVLSQLHRAALAGKEAGPPSIHNLTGGGPLENDADQVCLIDHTTTVKGGPGASDTTELHLAKNRHGRHVKFQTRWDFTTYRVAEPAVQEFGRANV